MSIVLMATTSLARGMDREKLWERLPSQETLSRAPVSRSFPESRQNGHPQQLHSSVLTHGDLLTLQMTLSTPGWGEVASNHQTMGSHGYSISALFMGQSQRLAKLANRFRPGMQMLKGG